MKNRLPRVLAIHDLSCLGTCSLTVALPVLSGFGIEAVPLPTALLSTHTGEFQNPAYFDLTGQMKAILTHWESLELKFEGIYSGYFCRKEQAGTTQRLIERYGSDALVLVDPVMADNGEWYTGFDETFVEAMKPLIALADVITPNATEAAFLLGEKPCVYGDGEALERCMQGLLALGAKQVVITGVRLAERPGSIGYFAGNQQGERLYYWQELVDRKLHGCGDVFASVLCASMLCGSGFFEGVKNAAAFVEEAIGDTVPEHWYGLQFEAGLRRRAREKSTQPV